jgi:hypothetical protein
MPYCFALILLLNFYQLLSSLFFNLFNRTAKLQYAPTSYNPQWTQCFNHVVASPDKYGDRPPSWPTSAFLGFTASTGNIGDHHDIMSVVVYRYYLLNLHL